MPRPDRKTQIRLTRETADTLRRLAADLGYVQTRGIMAGELGSVAQMFDAVARGELNIVSNRHNSALDSAATPTERSGSRPDAK